MDSMNQRKLNLSKTQRTVKITPTNLNEKISDPNRPQTRTNESPIRPALVMYSPQSWNPPCSTVKLGYNLYT